jgi:hypothetical protein
LALILDAAEIELNLFADPAIGVVAVGVHQDVSVRGVQSEDLATLKNYIGLVEPAFLHGRDLEEQRLVFDIGDFQILLAAVLSHVHCQAPCGARVGSSGTVRQSVTEEVAEEGRHQIVCPPTRKTMRQATPFSMNGGGHGRESGKSEVVRYSRGNTGLQFLGSIFISDITNLVTSFLSAWWWKKWKSAGGPTAAGIFLWAFSLFGFPAVWRARLAGDVVV